MSFATPELIAKKRDGQALTSAEIQHLIAAFTRGDIADYQMSAFAMAVFWRGMTPQETTALTLAMRDSGAVIDLSDVPGFKVDKHSTGGVGDKISLCLAPLVAACGVSVPMVSGRGLGHTGGTLDKLEAIPGFSVQQSVEVFRRQVRHLGCSLIGQTGEIAPADKRLYALRDVTATVESIPLITASILSKKLAEGINGLVLDVKVGRGAFMKNKRDATRLAESIVRVGKLAKLRVTAFLTAMDRPLGRAIGNALETREAFEILHNRGPEDVRELTLVLGAEMLRMAKVDKSDASARKRLELALKDGSALRKMQAIVEAQGGDPKTVIEPDRLPRTRNVFSIRAGKAGFVQAIDPLELGLAGVGMGAGRTRAEQSVDPAVGIVVQTQVGEKVARDAVLAELHLHEENQEIAARVADAFTIGASRKRASPLVLAKIQ